MAHSNVSNQIAQMVSLACLLMKLVYGTPIGEAFGSNSINVESSTDDASGKVPLRNVSWHISSCGAYALNGSSVEVLHPGNYFIYAQVTFYTAVQFDSFQITVNDNPSVSCMSSQQVSLEECTRLNATSRADCVEAKSVTKSCYAGAVRGLKAGDKIKIVRDRQTDGKVLVGPTDTFFGLTKF